MAATEDHPFDSLQLWRVRHVSKIPLFVPAKLVYDETVEVNLVILDVN